MPAGDSRLDAGPVAPPRRRLLRIAAAGAICALLVMGAGWLLRRVTFGADLGAGRARVESDVRTTFEGMARQLRDMTAPVADASATRQAAAGDTAAARRLFTAAAEAVGAGPAPDAALTVYGAENGPVAWAGRPSELPGDRLQGPESWFVAQGALGLRLVYIRPLGDPAARAGTIAAEQPLSSDEEAGGMAGLPGDTRARFQFSTALAPVSIELPFEAARATSSPTAFDVASPSGEPLLSAVVSSEDLAATRDRWRRAANSIALIVLAVTAVLLAGPILDWRNRLRDPGRYAAAVSLGLVCIVAGRVLLRVASPADWSGSPVFSGAAFASALAAPWLSSPFDFVATALTAGAAVALAAFAVEAWRVGSARRRRAVGHGHRLAAYLAVQLAAGIAIAAVLFLHQRLLRDTVANSTLDLLHFSLHPWNSSTPARLSLHVGLIVWHVTALSLGVLILRAAVVPWCVRRGAWRLRLATLACWAAPLFVWQAWRNDVGSSMPLVAALAAMLGLALAATRLKARYRHGSQAFRLTLLTLALIVPAFAFYPAVVALSTDAKEQLVQTRYAPQALNQRQTVQMQVQRSLAEIDEFPGLADLVSARSPGDAGASEMAFQVWRTTALSTYPVTSSVELYGPDGTLIDRFAFNLPEDLAETPLSDEQTCDWDVYEEVAPFFAEERRILHAGRRFCSPQAGARPLGSIVVHAMLDWENLPFISSQSPYVELLRTPDPLRGEGVSGGDVEFAAYGWSRSPLYSSADAAWPLPDAVFATAERSRDPFWAELRRGDDRYRVYLTNDRGGIYALGFPVLPPLGHLVNLAEITVLAVGTYVLLLMANALFGSVSRRGTTAPALLREIRASFYRKLFLAFVAAVFLPVVALALVTRYYIADQMRANIEQEAVRTASAAVRVVEDLVALRAAQQGVEVDDNLLVWVSRLIDQDVNVFVGPRLLATSERNLFASGLLPTRTHAEVYHAITLRREAAIVTDERIRRLEYLVAATSLSVPDFDGLLSVPLTSRQQEIDEQIDTLDRRVLLAALLFMLAGAGLGYSMAERISDPVNRLTRATRRIARGDLDARIAATSSDELRRLVEDFNSMAGELQRQRKELERTHRLEAWAEMARQVAHEIKNPLTPIQLNAEHLRRVHADRGKPLHPILEECVSTILTQVRLLRQIASEFSSFASSPTAKLAPVDVPDLLHEIVDPYRKGLDERIRFDVDIPPALPPVQVDRTLIARSITNLVENALHAMPGAGTITVLARADDGRVRISVSDTGVGMDAEALSRAFEPYFSTKATGTGLGLPIAKRNVELSGGTISVSSEKDKGTTVELSFPALEGREG